MTEPFLRIPPFPGHRAGPLSQSGTGANVDPTALMAALAKARVGGSFWAAQPVLAPATTVLAPVSPAQLAEMLAAAPSGATLAVMAPRGWALPAQVTRLPAVCDPWWLADKAGAVWAGADHELALVAALVGKPVRPFGEGRFASLADTPEALAESVTTTLAQGIAYRCPYTGTPRDALGAIALMAPWRGLIDGNRRIGAVLGAARWKRITLDAMLWDGSGPVRHRRTPPRDLAPGRVVLAWKSRCAPKVLAQLAQRGAAVAELEDGFIRSVGLGANCVPPLSVVVDFGGIYFDPTTPSDLETLLEQADIAPEMRTRATALRAALVAGSISKYGAHAGSSGDIVHAPAGRRRVLVTGQVEDDRSVLSGGAIRSNLALLAAARAAEPEAHIIYKPHPDVEAGHRKGHVSAADALAFADEIIRDVPIIPLIEAVDGLHVITSLAGFEALLRGKAVTVHGTPFYAGWGLTEGSVRQPVRRTRSRSLDELVAASLLLYPRYIDPVTRLPCPAEILLHRMEHNQAHIRSALIKLRACQGRARLILRRLGSSRLFKRSGAGYE